MNIAERRLDSITPYARNPRRNQQAVATVKASLAEFGWQQPIVVDAEGIIIVGHTRYQAALELGMETAPVQVADSLTPAQARAYRIMDNRSAENAEWDNDLLSLELEDLRLEDFDLDLTGFDHSELDGLLDASIGSDGATDSDTEPEIDRAEELRQKWGVEPGQLWRLGEHLLLCGDSTKAEDVARVLGDDKPHLMVTDPPYGVEYDADWRNHALRSDGTAIAGRAVGKVMNDDRADWRDAWALFPGDVAYVWHAGVFSHVVAQSLESCAFQMRALVVWAKSNFAIGRGHYHHKHEPCWYAVRKGGTGHWCGDRAQTTLWDIPKPAKSETGHSTQKPLECMAIPMRNNSQPGDAVYEPFSGSGTTIIAGENLGRKVRAIEISPAYVAVALERWHAHTGRQPELSP